MDEIKAQESKVETFDSCCILHLYGVYPMEIRDFTSDTDEIFRIPCLKSQPALQ